MQLSMRDAIKLAIREEMAADPSVVVFGEDVGEPGGVFKVTAGLYEEFGPARVRDTPISETAILGAAVGAAASGLRPVVEIMFAEFFGVAIDQIVTEGAKMRYLSNGRIGLPLVVRASAGSGLSFGAQHSQTLETWFMNTPGLVVVSPSGPRSAYGLMRASIRSEDPVIFIEPRTLYGLKEDFDPAAARAAIGRAEVAREGRDVTLVALGQTVRTALAAAELLAPDLAVEVIDLGTILPWDRDAVLASVRRTGRFVTLEENPRTGGWGGDLVSAVTEEGFADIAAPTLRLTAPDAPVPFGALERAYLPTAEEVAAAIGELVRTEAAPAPRWESWGKPARATAQIGSEAPARRGALATAEARFERLVEIRAFEDAVHALFLEGQIPGTTHTCQGQEAIAVGIAAATRVTDTVTCTYRGHGMALALGMTPFVAMAEILGRVDGCVGGKGGSMHLVDPDIGLLPTFAIVGAGLPVAAGAAYAAQVRGTDALAVAVFGDGATNIGAFHESLNLASVWKLPVLFVCENNLYGEYSPIARTTPVADIADRAASYAMPSCIVDGQDLDAVGRALGDAVARARSGGGPTLLEMKTYRFTGHSRGDPAKYRPEGELERWKERDPITLYERQLLASGTTQDALDALRERASERVEAAVAKAQASEAPGTAEMLANVLATGR